MRQPPLAQRQVPSNAGAPVSQAQPARPTGHFQPKNARAEDESSDGSYDDISDIYSQEDGTQVDQNEEEEQEQEQEQQQQLPAAVAGDAKKEGKKANKVEMGRVHQTAAPHPSTQQDVSEADGATECRSVGDEDEDEYEEEEDLEDGKNAALTTESEEATLAVFDQDEDDAANLPTDSGIEEAPYPLPPDMGKMRVEQEDGEAEEQAQQAGGVEEGGVADGDAAVDLSSMRVRSKKATKRGRDHGKDHEEAVLVAGGDGVAGVSPSRARRTEPTVTKRWSSSLGRYVEESEQQPTVHTNQRIVKETEGGGVKQILADNEDTGGRARRAASTTSQSKAQTCSKEAAWGGASGATESDITKPLSTRREERKLVAEVERFQKLDEGSQRKQGTGKEAAGKRSVADASTAPEGVRAGSKGKGARVKQEKTNEEDQAEAP